MKEKEEREKETTMISILIFLMALFKNSLVLVGCIFSLKTWILEIANILSRWDVILFILRLKFKQIEN